MTIPSTRVPAALQDQFNAIAQAADAFCDQRLNGEYQHLIRLALAALSRKRPSPLLKGKDAAWAAGAVHALGMVNFFDLDAGSQRADGRCAAHAAGSAGNSVCQRIYSVCARPERGRRMSPALSVPAGYKMTEVGIVLNDWESLPLGARRQISAWV